MCLKLNMHLIFCSIVPQKQLQRTNLWPISREQSYSGHLSLSGWRRVIYFRYKSWTDQCLLCFNSKQIVQCGSCVSFSLNLVSVSQLICSKPGGPRYQSQISDRSSSILGPWNWRNIDYKTAVFISGVY